MKKQPMIVQIDGTNKKNKGAELMFYAIIQELEKKCPSATIRYVGDPVPSGYFHTEQKILIPWQRTRLVESLHMRRILSELHKICSRFNYYIIKKNTKILFDASGFAFSDKWNWSNERNEMFTDYLRRHHDNGTKIVFLPQALGPFEKNNSKRRLEAINRYADLLIAREEVSYDYALKAGFNKEKLLLYPDFTVSVQGIVPDRYKDQYDYLTIIPNCQMIRRGGESAEGYQRFLVSAIHEGKQNGRKVFLLNHEGPEDLALCRRIGQEQDVEVVSDLNALETKGFISRSYLVISSRFHGVASALDTAVPCLATSWSHKYEMLFKDYEQQNCVLDTSDNDSLCQRIREMLSPENNRDIRTKLKERIAVNNSKTEEMWQTIWNTIGLPSEH
ncbi:MAG: polysaccharide pyruvyl transferase family protein [Paludibacteraceae bacterium]|nr:polysaccharide pyruvyl transferase family protein [Paludibacteraceae bacterium]